MGAITPGPLKDKTKVLNILDYGGSSDGVTDNVQPLLDALADIPAASKPYSDSRSAGGSVIFFPAGADPDGFYRFSAEVTINLDKNVTILGAGSHATRIKTDAGVNYAFFRDSPNGVFYSFKLSQMSLDKCGVRIDYNSRNWHIFEELFFRNTDDYAIRMESIDGVENSVGSVIGGEIRNCEFFACHGAIKCVGNQSDQWVVDNCIFTKNLFCDIQLFTSGWRIRDCWFEQRNGNGDKNEPFINVAGDSGDVHITGCRFGNEVSGTDMPPRECIVVGGLGLSESGTMNNIEISGNRFRGRSGGTTASSANAAIRFNIGISNAYIKDNSFFPYNTCLIQFAHANSDFGVSNEVSHQPEGSTPLFSEEPTQGKIGGWKVIGREPSQASEKDRETTQLLKRTDAIDAGTGWSTTNATITKDATGPDGLANSAYTMDKPASGSSTVSSNPDTFTGDICVSCWFKKGVGLDYARLSIGSLIPNTFLIPLTDQWEQWWFWFPSAGGALTYTIGADTVGSAAIGSLLFAFPQIEPGRRPTQYLSRTGTVLRSRPGGWVQLGANVMGYGDAAPTSGDFIVGDRVINNAQITGNRAVGFVCVASGNPGTWKSITPWNSLYALTASFGVSEGASDQEATLGRVAFPGAVLGLSVHAEDARTAGTLTVNVKVEGVTVLTAIIDATNTESVVETDITESLAVAAEDEVTVQVVGDAAYENAAGGVTGVVVNVTLTALVPLV